MDTIFLPPWLSILVSLSPFPSSVKVSGERVIKNGDELRKKFGKGERNTEYKLRVKGILHEDAEKEGVRT